MKLPIFYVIFAMVATVVNLATQEIVFQIYTYVYPLGVSIFFGTLTGLIVKYVLDKKFIFNYQTRSKSQDSQTFLLYSFMGITTTVIFWATEFAFDAWFATKTMRYVGACIGLSIGYVTKYYLDKKYVFIER
ncbi:MAG: putative flippase GtrA [Francisellaceae bacterium]|jgi:putative flippase GtrA